MAKTNEEVGADLLIEAINTVDSDERAAFDAIRSFVETVDEALPGGGKRGAPRRRVEVVEAGLQMIEQLLGVSNDVARRLTESVREALPAIERNVAAATKRAAAKRPTKKRAAKKAPAKKRAAKKARKAQEARRQESPGQEARRRRKPQPRSAPPRKRQPRSAPPRRRLPAGRDPRPTRLSGRAVTQAFPDATPAKRPTGPRVRPGRAGRSSSDVSRSSGTG